MRLVVVFLACILLFGCVSFGPVSSPQFTNLVQKAIQVESGDMQMLGPSQWYPNTRGFTDTRNFVHPDHQNVTNGVLAVTFSAIYIVQWDKTDNNYHVLKRFMLAQIKEVTLDTYGLSRSVVVQWNDYSTDSFSFISDSGQTIDRRKTESLYKLLSSNIKNN